MTWNQIATYGAACVLVLWVVWRTERQFRAGYLRALDHVDDLARPNRHGGALGAIEAVRKLRGEMNASPTGSEAK